MIAIFVNYPSLFWKWRIIPINVSLVGYLVPNVVKIIFPMAKNIKNVQKHGYGAKNVFVIIVEDYKVRMKLNNVVYVDLILYELTFIFAGIVFWKERRALCYHVFMGMKFLLVPCWQPRKGGFVVGISVKYIVEVASLLENFAFVLLEDGYNYGSFYYMQK
jgi:hypothetical protein